MACATGTTLELGKNTETKNAVEYGMLCALVKHTVLGAYNNNMFIMFNLDMFEYIN